MHRHLHIAANVELDERVIDLDLTDEEGMLVEDFAERNPQGTRALLAALNLKNPAASSEPVAEVMDMAVYRATGDRRLATLFGRAA